MNDCPTPAPLSAGAKFRAAIAAEKPLQVVGAINAYAARMAEATGFRALYLSGGGVAANSLGLPDLGISTMDDVLIDIRRITEASTLPLLVDADTGWGGAFNIARTVKSFIKAGAAGMHIEDQVQSKRCGHRPGKEVVPAQEMVDRIKAGVDARSDASFVIMARSDALASRGPRRNDRAAGGLRGGGRGRDLSRGHHRPRRCIARCATRCACRCWPTSPSSARHLCIRARSWARVGVDIVLHCCSAYRAMNLAALKVYQAIRRDGTQKNVRRPHADARRPLQVSRLPRLRAEAR